MVKILRENRKKGSEQARVGVYKVSPPPGMGKFIKLLGKEIKRGKREKEGKMEGEEGKGKGKRVKGWLCRKKGKGKRV